MPTGKDLARQVDELAAEITGYRDGKSGENGLCDCIGLVMGAMKTIARVAYPMHSTNYFARKQMSTLHPLTMAEQLQMGMLVYKARSDTSQLNDRYQYGGRYYTGDMLDYYHVGVVTGLLPLEITHCTSTKSANGIVRDTTANGWTHYGKLMGVDYGDTEDNRMVYTAYVSATQGRTVNLRKRPDIAAKVVERVALGKVVEVKEEAEDWAQVETQSGNTGYMMVKFLTRIGDGTETIENVPESNEDSQKQASDTSFEEQVLELLKRIYGVIKARNEGVG